jgi:hypothetical protein
MNSRVLRKTYNIELFKMVNDFGHLNKLLRIPSLTLIKKKPVERGKFMLSNIEKLRTFVKM